MLGRDAGGWGEEDQDAGEGQGCWGGGIRMHLSSWYARGGKVEVGERRTKM